MDKQSGIYGILSRNMCQKHEGYTENPDIYGFDVPKRNPALIKSGSLHSFELDRWSKPDENHRVKHIDMAGAKETFDKLKMHLKAHGPLPDGYFLYPDELSGGLSEFEEALCVPNFGSSEGTYLDISLACRDSDGRRYFQSFAAGKTLGKTADDYLRMFRIATECFLMLNGRGLSYERNNVDVVLTGRKAVAVANSMELDLCDYLEPEAEALLSFALDGFTGIPCTAIQTIICHERDDYAVWNVEIPSDMSCFIVREAAERVETLEKLMSGMGPSSGYEMRLLTQTKGGRFAFFTIPEWMNGLWDHGTQSSSVRESREQIAAKILTDWEPAGEPENEMER